MQFILIRKENREDKCDVIKKVLESSLVKNSLYCFVHKIHIMRICNYILCHFAICMKLTKEIDIY